MQSLWFGEFMGTLVLVQLGGALAGLLLRYAHL
jgi:hypothetical protein